ncbi:glycosyltransferase family 2 protein [Rhodanobacter sp. AS-Z3]|uniref:glycosyltransferase family 2 protein n=1 Tax=Rhodanobacter sp. AS-Z3 TaxID=3031330 RepID=UPI00247B183D|nr:glycosyltransferase family 2 protein [Rhodanobacter sp. AS-Z3]WEN16917.1 glycosyltransferase family 2 protein [Rhodanobacter sp. AS-Z3]
MARPRTSIVICTYNGAAYLQAQLDSLLGQTLLPDEIVVGDDGSTDATMEMLATFKAYAEQAGVTIQLRQNSQNLGYVENFSVGLRQASGELLFLCDQDDVWYPDKLARMVAAFEAKPGLLLLHSDARLVDAQGASLNFSMFEALSLTAREKQAIHVGAAFDVVLRRCFVTGATAAIRCELVDLALPVAPEWIHDEWLAAVASAVGQVDCIDDVLIDYRQHGANQVGARKRTLAMKWRELAMPRGEQLSGEARRLQRLEQFLRQAGFAGAVDRANQVEQKRVHFERRAAMGRRARWRRVPTIVREARMGFYKRYGTGVRAMLRDLLRND